MKAFVLAALVLLSHACCTAQTSPHFEVRETIVSKASDRKLLSSSTPKKGAAFYEDDRYVVTRSCAGEWGGTVLFKNKATGRLTFCEATCPAQINRLAGNYYVTTYLGHLEASCAVIEIADPDSMQAFQPMPSFRERSSSDSPRVANAPSRWRGITMLARGRSRYIVASFPYNGTLYHIMYDYKSCYIARIENGVFVTLQTLPDIDTRKRRDRHEAFTTTNDHTVVFAKIGGKRGRVDISGSIITLIKYR